MFVSSIVGYFRKLKLCIVVFFFYNMKESLFSFVICFNIKFDFIFFSGINVYFLCYSIFKVFVVG